MQAVCNADYGAYPKDCRQRIRRYLDRVLPDARSAQANIVAPPKKVFGIRIDGNNPQGYYSESK